MKKIKLCAIIAITVLVLVYCLAPFTSSSNIFVLKTEAHSGRTDSHGGHHDNRNKSGLGNYHYHHGYAAHLHPNGVCPYSNTAKVKSQSSSTGSATSNTAVSASGDLVAEQQNNTVVTPQNNGSFSTEYDNLVFCAQYYYDHNEDLQSAIGKNEKSLYDHFKKHGMKEGRQAISTFNVNTYKDNNVDLVEAFGEDLPKYFDHYIQCGCKEKRVCH